MQKNCLRLIRGPGPSGSYPGPAVRTLRGLSTPFRHQPPPAASSINRSLVSADTPPRTGLNADGPDLAAQGLILYPVRSVSQRSTLPERGPLHIRLSIGAHWTRSALLEHRSHGCHLHMSESCRKSIAGFAASKALSTAKAGDWPRQAFQGKQGRSILDAMRPAQPREVKQGSVRRV